MPRSKPEPRVYLRGKTYWGRYYTPDGRLKRRSTRQRDEQAAKDIVRGWEQDAADPARAAARQTTLEHVLDDYLAEQDALCRAGKRSRATVIFYGERAGVLLLVLGDDLRAADLTAAVVDGFIAARRREGVTESTIAKDLVTLRAAFRLAKRRGRWFGDIDAVFPRGFATGYKPRERFLSPAELRALLPRLWADDAARVAFCIATSAERGATDRARREDIAADRSRVRLRGTKRELRARVVPIITPWQRDLLDYALTHAKGEGERLFSPDPRAFEKRLSYACKKTLRRPEISHVCPNDLRRTCATWLRAEGAPVELLAPFLGHTDGRMVERVYARLEPAMLAARLRTALGIGASAPDCAAFVSDPPPADTLSGPIGRLDGLPAPRPKKRRGRAVRGVARAAG
jgi:integrase